MAEGMERLMASAVYPHVPGTYYGPCLDECEHRDCKAQRRDALKLCSICGLRIGFGVRTYVDPNCKRNPLDYSGATIEYVHAECLEGLLDD